MSVEAVDDAYLVANEKGVVVDVTDAGCRLFGRPRDEIIGLRLAPHSPPEILVSVGRRWAELRTTGMIRGSTEIERPDGSHETVDYVAQFDLPVRGWALVRLRPTMAAGPG